MALTEKKRRFADALLSGAGKTKAAIDAGYSEKTAPQAASKLLKDADVTAYMERRKVFDETREEVKSEVNQVKSDAAAAADSSVPESRASLERIARTYEELHPELAAKIWLGLLPYDLAKKGDVGKKEQAKEKAAEVAQGRFGSRKPPLSVVR